MRRHLKNKQIEILERLSDKQERHLESRRATIEDLLEKLSTSRAEHATALRERDAARAQRNVLSARLNTASRSLSEGIGGGALAAGDYSARIDAVEPVGRYVLEEGRPIHVGQVRRNRDFATTDIRILAPPRTTSRGVDDTWLVEYLTSGRTIRRASSFVRTFYPKVVVWSPEHALRVHLTVAH